jgi:glycosyltransferase involved in cell wall biosynthesis
MRIAQVSSLYEAVPPRMYGGTERIVSYITEELVRQGHEVTLFASGDSVTNARLIPVSEKALRLEKSLDPLAWHVLLLQEVFERADNFDLIHYHIDYLHFPFSRLMRVPQLTTLHGRLNLPDLPPLYQKFPDMPVISISDNQRAPLPMANWFGTVYHGLPLDLYSYGEGKGDYMAFIGRISPEKRVDRAIELAKSSGVKLKIAAKVDRVDQEYFEKEIRPTMDHPLIEFIGEIGEEQKKEFLGNARLLIFPIDWPEPFGLVMIEAMACGTPVVAFRCGSVPEVIDQGITGLVVDSMEEARQAIENIASVNRQQCRRQFEKRFSVQRMVQDYVGNYEKLLSEYRQKQVFLNGRHVPYNFRRTA